MCFLDGPLYFIFGIFPYNGNFGSALRWPNPKIHNNFEFILLCMRTIRKIWFDFVILNVWIGFIPFEKFVLFRLFLENSDLTSSETWFRAIFVIRWFMAISPPRALSHPHQCWRKMMNSHWTSHFVNVKINNVSFISFDFSHLFSRQLEVWYVSQFESGRWLHMNETGIRARIYIYLCILTHTYSFSPEPESIFATVRKQTKCYFLYTDISTLPTDGQAAVCGMWERMR